MADAIDKDGRVYFTWEPSGGHDELLRQASRRLERWERQPQMGSVIHRPESLEPPSVESPRGLWHVMVSEGRSDQPVTNDDRRDTLLQQIPGIEDLTTPF